MELFSARCISHLLFLLLLPQFVAEPGVLRHPGKSDCTNRAVSLLGYDNLCNILIFRIRIIIIISINKHTDVGILLDCSGFSKVRQHRPLVCPLLYRTTQLRQRNYRNVQLTCKFQKFPADGFRSYGCYFHSSTAGSR